MKGIEAYAKLDDFDYFAEEAELKANVVQTSDEDGLTEETVRRAVEIINGIDKK